MRTGNKSKLLFVSPFMPCRTGGGSAMRAFNTLKVLSSCYDIDLLVFSLGLRKFPAPHSAVKKICSRIVINVSHPVYDFRYWLQRILEKACNKISISITTRTIEICPGLTPHRKKKLQQSFEGKHFHTIHIFRLADYPVFGAISNVVSYDHLQLDLDDIESDNYSQIKELYKSNGNVVQADLAGRLTVAYQKLEESVLPTIELIFVCSAHDSAKLKMRYQCQQITVLPNVYPLPKKINHTQGVEKFRLLFVGRLGYKPNADAIFYFCDQILPLLQKMATSQFELRIIGDWKQLPGKTRKIIAKLSEIVMLGKVDDVGPYYQQADAAIVPLRVGAGTRIKILEAFAFQVPVVSTSKGIEGLETTHGQHALIADTPLDFARQCVQLMENPSLRDNLVQNARTLVESKYSPDRLKEILCKEKSL
ncbi:glycosyltransferase [Thermodesulfobacteriota bacterium]